MRLRTNPVTYRGQVCVPLGHTNGTIDEAVKSFRGDCSRRVGD